MVILLQINKITFERSKNLEKIQNLTKILTENCSFFFKKKIFSWFFLNCCRVTSIWKSQEKSEQIALPNLDYNSSNTRSQIWNAWRIKVSHFTTCYNFHMLQFCKNRLKFEQKIEHCHWYWYKITCKLSIKS